MRMSSWLQGVFSTPGESRTRFQSARRSRSRSAHPGAVEQLEVRALLAVGPSPSVYLSASSPGNPVVNADESGTVQPGIRVLDTESQKFNQLLAEGPGYPFEATFVTSVGGRSYYPTASLYAAQMEVTIGGTPIGAQGAETGRDSFSDSETGHVVGGVGTEYLIRGVASAPRDTRATASAYVAMNSKTPSFVIKKFELSGPETVEFSYEFTVQGFESHLQRNVANLSRTVPISFYWYVGEAYPQYYDTGLTSEYVHAFSTQSTTRLGVTQSLTLSTNQTGEPPENATAIVAVIDPVTSEQLANNDPWDDAGEVISGNFWYRGSGTSPQTLQNYVQREEPVFATIGLGIDFDGFSTATSSDFEADPNRVAIYYNNPFPAAIRPSVLKIYSSTDATLDPTGDSMFFQVPFDSQSIAARSDIELLDENYQPDSPANLLAAGHHALTITPNASFRAQLQDETVRYIYAVLDEVDGPLLSDVIPYGGVYIAGSGGRLVARTSPEEPASLVIGRSGGDLTLDVATYHTGGDLAFEEDPIFEVSLTAPTSAVSDILVMGSEESDWLVVTADDFQIPITAWGGGGDDAVVSGAGPDRLFGEDGDDIILGEGFGSTVSLPALRDWRNSLRLGQLTSIPGATSGMVGVGEDEISGGNGFNVLIGGGGDDDISNVGDGDALIIGDSFNFAAMPTISFNALFDAPVAGESEDDMDARIRRQLALFTSTMKLSDTVAHVGSGNDSITGGDGAELIWAGPGNDDIVTGSGPIAIVSGDDGDDTIDGNYEEPANAAAILFAFGGAGEDTLTAGLDCNVLIGGDDNDDLQGSSNNDVLIGDNVDLTRPTEEIAEMLASLKEGNFAYVFGLTGDGEGDDILEGNGGIDVMIGGDGTDSFGDSSGTGSNIVFDPFVSVPEIRLEADTNVGDESSGTVVTLTAIVSRPVVTDQIVELVVEGTGITSADYSLTTDPGTSPVMILIPAGKDRGTATFTVLDDNTVEPTETARVSLTNPPAGFNLGVPYFQDIEITSDDITGQPEFVVTAPVGRTENKRPLITWTAVDNALSYDLWVNIAGGGANIVKELSLSASQTSYQLDDDLDFAVYRVFVYANMPGGTQQTAAGHTFIVDEKPVLTPIGATTDTSPTFTWNRVPGAATYILFVSVPGGSVNETVTDSGSGSTMSYTYPGTLPRNDYKWWVRAVRDNEFKGVWSDVSEFSTGGRSKVTSPVRNSVVTTSIPNFEWPAVPGAESYEVYVSKVGTAGALYRDAGITNNHIGARVLEDGSYKVWIRTTLPGGSAVWGSGVSFTVATTVTDLQTTPFNPATPSFDTTPTFQWTAASGAETYDIYLHSGTTTILLTGLTGTSHPRHTDLSKGHWAWNIRPVNSSGVGKWSPTIAFTTNGQTSFLSPSATTSDRTPTFTWRGVAGASGFSLQVNSGTSGTTQVFREDVIIGTSFTPDAELPAGTYRAWIRAFNTIGIGVWSRPLTFVIASASPDANEAEGPAGSLVATLSSLPELTDTAQTYRSVTTEFTVVARKANAVVAASDSAEVPTEAPTESLDEQFTEVNALLEAL